MNPAKTAIATVRALAPAEDITANPPASEAVDRGVAARRGWPGPSRVGTAKAGGMS